MVSELERESKSETPPRLRSYAEVMVVHMQLSYGRGRGQGSIWTLDVLP
jgi:hypothetical protein